MVSLRKSGNSSPDILNKLFRSFYNTFETSWISRNTVNRQKSRKKLHRYWKQPWDGSNLPQSYLEGKARSKFLAGIMKKYIKPDAKILEIGCNVGRNLNYLFQKDFKNLGGIEISEKAVRLLQEAYPEMASQTNIYNAPVEDKIKDFKDRDFDVVFTMAVLEHIHTDSEWIFKEMVRITKGYLVTVEDERGSSWRHFPRNYKKIFMALGMKQVEEIKCNEVPGLGANFYARIFKKE